MAIVVTVSVCTGCTPDAAPNANAGWDQSVEEGATVELRGSGLDPDGWVTGHSWQQKAGPDLALENNGQESITFVAPAVDSVTEFVFELSVTDNANKTGVDEVTITVHPYGQVSTTVLGLVRNHANREGIVGASVTALQYSDGTARILSRATSVGTGAFDLQLRGRPGRVNLHFESNGFADQSVVVDLGEPISDRRIIALMVPIQEEHRFDAGEDSSLHVQGQLVLSIDGATLVDATGQPPRGYATAALSVLDPSSDPTVMPGDFTAWDAQTETGTPIESFGALAVSLTSSDGASLDLAPDATAEIAIPIPASLIDNAPGTVPLFYWSDELAYWVEDGSATLTDQGSGSWAFAGSVSHFSTWNADVAYESVNVQGCVTDPSGVPVDGAEVTARGVTYTGTSSASTDVTGRFEVRVRPESTVAISVNAPESMSEDFPVETTQEDLVLEECLELQTNAPLQDMAISIQGRAGEIEICVRDHECEDGDEVSVQFERTTLFSDAISNDWECQSVAVEADRSYPIELLALNGTGHQGACSFADVNTGQIRVSGRNVATQTWRHRGGAGSRANIVVKTAPASIRITSHVDNQRINSRIVEVEGIVTPSRPITVKYNDIEQPISVLESGQFNASVVLQSGQNSIVFCADGTDCTTLDLVADIEEMGLMATLTWSSRGDLDLHVRTPSGAHCYHGNKRVNGSCVLDIDDQRGVNPENITIPTDAAAGLYRFSVVNYSGGRGVRAELRLYRSGQLINATPFTVQGGNRSTALSREVNYSR